MRIVIFTLQRYCEDELAPPSEREFTATSVIRVLLGPWGTPVSRADKSLEFKSDREVSHEAGSITKSVMRTKK